MAGSDKITRRVDAGGSTTKSTKPVSEASSSSAEKQSVKERDAEWGFEPSKSGMAVEAKMGMGIVTILVCAFGFLVYHKFDLRQRELLKAQMNGAGEQSITAAADSKVQTFNEFYPDEATEDPAAIAAVTAEVRPGFGNVVEATADDVNPTATDSHDAFVAIASPEDSGPFFEMDEPKFEPASERSSAFMEAAPSGTAVPDDTTEDLLATLVADSATNAEAFQPGNSINAEAVPGTEVPPSSGSTSAVSSLFDGPSEEVPVANSDVSPFPAFDEPVAQPLVNEPPVNEPAVAAIGPQTERALPPATSAFGGDQEPVADLGKREAEPLFAEMPPPSATELPPADSSLPVQSVSETVPMQPGELEQKLKSLVTDTSVAEQPTPVADASPFPAFDQPTADRSEILPSPRDAFQESPDSNRTIAAPESTLIAMLEPAPDVNLFEDDAVKQPKSPPVTRELPNPDVSSQPAVSPRLAQATEPHSLEPAFRPFIREPKVQEDTVPVPKPLSNSFDAQVQSSTPKPQQPVNQFVIPQESPATVDSNPPLRMPSPSFDDVEKEEFGVAKFVEPPRVQQVAGTVDPEIADVRPNDTYWTISKRVYGTARYFSSLALYNQHRIRDPKKLRAGMKVLVPTPDILEAKYPELFRDYQRKPKLPTGYFVQTDGSPAYRVGERETLSGISQKHLGRASRWIQIYQLNRNILKDPNKLKPGSMIVLPADATDVHMTP